MWEGLVGSFLPQVCLDHWLESNDYVRFLLDNNVYIKDKQMVYLSYRSNFEVTRNCCVSQLVHAVPMFRCVQPRFQKLWIYP